MARKDHLIQVLLGEWRQWPVKRQPMIVKHFRSGFNHQTVLLKGPLIREGPRNVLFVLKRFRSPNPHAIRAQKWAAEHGIAPKIYFESHDHAYVLMERSTSSIVSLDVFDDDSVRQLAVCLSTLHHGGAGPVSTDGFDYLRSAAIYLKNVDLPTVQMHQCLAPALTVFANDSTPKCYCHNDLVKENIFFGPARVNLIDWEYSDLNNPWFDLASLIVYCGFSQTQAAILLAEYQQGLELKQSEPIYLAAQIAVLWLDVLWCKSKQCGEEDIPLLESKWQLVKTLNRRFNQLFPTA